MQMEASYKKKEGNKMKYLPCGYIAKKAKCSPQYVAKIGECLSIKGTLMLDKKMNVPRIHFTNSQAKEIIRYIDENRKEPISAL